MATDERKTNKSDLSEEDIQFIMANTDFERDKILQWYEDFKKQCPSGKLTKAQFIKFYKQLIKGSHADEDELCSAVFEVFDTDDNGTVDFGEFLIAFWIRAKGDVRDKLEWLFDIYDCDDSNYITKWELTKMLKLLLNVKGMKDDPYKKADEIFNAIDRSKDGRLSKPEFIAGCMKRSDIKTLFTPF